MKLDLDTGIKELATILSSGNLSIFVGSGISIDSDLPSWDGLLKEFIKMAGELKITDKRNKLELNNILKNATESLDSDERIHDPIRIATVIKNKISECDLKNQPLAQQKYKGWLAEVFGGKIFNEKHKLIVDTDYPFILTSNYDLLLEDAAYESGHDQLSVNSYTYEDELKIMSSIHNGKECIIHVHGQINDIDIDKLIFTKEDYNKIILKEKPGFSFALRMLFTRYSTLFVGYGASDPHLEEIMEEISEYFPPNGIDNAEFPLPKSYLVVKRDKADLIFEKWKDRVRTNIIVIDDFSDYIKLLKTLKNTKTRK